MKRIENIFKNVLLDVRNFTNFKTAINKNCETQKDKEALKEYIEAISLNTHVVESFCKKYGFNINNASDIQSFVYMHMWNNPEIDLI